MALTDPGALLPGLISHTAQLEQWKLDHERKHLSIEQDIQAVDDHVHSVSSKVDHIALVVDGIERTLTGIRQELAAQGAKTTRIDELVTRTSWAITIGATVVTATLALVKQFPWFIDGF